MDQETFTKEYNTGFIITWKLFLRKGIPNAQDWAQAAWTRAWEKRDQWRGDSTFRSWVITIGVNLYRMSLRNTGAKYNQVDMIDQSDCWKFVNDVDNRLNTLSLTSQLPKSDQTILEHYFITGHTAKEVSELVGMNELGVKSRIHRAIKKMAVSA